MGTIPLPLQRSIDHQSTINAFPVTAYPDKVSDPKSVPGSRAVHRNLGLPGTISWASVDFAWATDIRSSARVSMAFSGHDY